MEETSPSGVEIERKFLVDRAPDGLGEGDRIEQGYLAIGDDGVEVRVRRRGDDMTLTIKSGPGMMRTEEELAIDARRFESLWSLTEGRRVSKTRHLNPLSGDRTPELLSGITSLEQVEFSGCAGLTGKGIAALARLPRLRELRVGGMTNVTSDIVAAFPASVRVEIGV